MRRIMLLFPLLLLALVAWQSPAFAADAWPVLALDVGPQATADGLTISDAAPSGGTTCFLTDFARLYTEPWEIGAGEAAFWVGAVALLVYFDRETYDAIQGTNSPEARRFFGAATNLGDGLTGLGIAALVALDDKKAAMDCIEAMLFAGLNVQVLKMTLGMARPSTGEGPVFTGPTMDNDYAAMPSGHAANAFALAAVLADKYPKYKWLFYTGAVLVGLSRIYLDAHWLSNVVAGAVIGIYSGQRVLGKEFTILKWEF